MPSTDAQNAHAIITVQAMLPNGFMTLSPNIGFKYQLQTSAFFSVDIEDVNVRSAEFFVMPDR